MGICNAGGPAAASAFNELYNRHKDYVVRVASRFLSDPDLALDALQETFGYLLRRFPPTGDGLTLTAQLRTLLYSVAKNSAITEQRKAARYHNPDGLDPDELAAAIPPETGDIAKALAVLPIDRREVVLLRFVDDMSLAEIALALDIPLGTVKSRLHLATRQLRDSPEAKEILEP